MSASVEVRCAVSSGKRGVNGDSEVRHELERNICDFTPFLGALWVARQLGETICTGPSTDLKDLDMLVQTNFDYEVLGSDLTVLIKSDPISTDY